MVRTPPPPVRPRLLRRLLRLLPLLLSASSSATSSATSSAARTMHRNLCQRRRIQPRTRGTHRRRRRFGRTARQTNHRSAQVVVAPRPCRRRHEGLRRTDARALAPVCVPAARLAVGLRERRRDDVAGRLVGDDIPHADGGQHAKVLSPIHRDLKDIGLGADQVRRGFALLVRAVAEEREHLDTDLARG